MNILMINDYGIKGSGTEVRLKLLIEELKQNHTIHLLEHETSDSTIEGVAVHKSSSQKAFTTTKKIIKNNDIDIVQIHNATQFNAEPFRAAHTSKVPILFSAHDYWAFCGQRNLVRNKKNCLGPTLLRCSSCTGFLSWAHTKRLSNLVNKAKLGISPSEFLKNQYESNGVLENKWKIVLPWVDLAELKQNKNLQRKKTVLFVGSLAYYKGAHNVVNALKLLPNKVTLDFIGGHQEATHPDRLRIEKLAKEEGVLDRLTFLGIKTHSELNEIYRQTGVIAFAPVWPEPSALTLQEAMACGCPIVATNKGGLPEFLENKGIIVESENTKELASSINYLLENEQLAKKLGNNAKKYALQKFTVENAAKEFVQLYDQLKQ